MTAELLVQTLEAYDARSTRSLQTKVGASEIGGCRRRTFYRMNGYPEVQSTSHFAAIKGTALHAHIEQAFLWLDPEHKRFIPEFTVPGMEGMGDAHIDLYDAQEFGVTDWKTTQKRNLRFFPKPAQRWQVQIYAECMVRAGYRVDWVELVAIPLDGLEADIKVYREPRDPEAAAQAYGWLMQLHEYAANGEIPPADLSGVICEQYCPFYGPDSCLGGLERVSTSSVSTERKAK